MTVPASESPVHRPDGDSRDRRPSTDAPRCAMLSPMTEPLWRLDDPRDHAFAEAGRRGAWRAVRPGLCPECGAPGQERTSPLIIEWMPGSDVVGDFTWAGLGDVAVTERAADVLRAAGVAIELGPVEMVEPTRRARRRDRRVALPYRGPTLFELIPTRWIDLDRQRSSVVLEHACGTCGTERFAVSGVEGWHIRWDKERRLGYRVHEAREPNSGIVVWARDAELSSIFHVHEVPSWMFCSTRVRDAVSAGGLTNVAFLESGEIVSTP